jgi:hypothetical protein
MSRPRAWWIVAVTVVPGALALGAAPGGAGGRDGDDARAQRVLLRLADLPGKWSVSADDRPDPEADLQPFAEACGDDAVDALEVKGAEARSPEYESADDERAASGSAVVFRKRAQAGALFHALRGGCLGDATASVIETTLNAGLGGDDEPVGVETSARRLPPPDVHAAVIADRVEVTLTGQRPTELVYDLYVLRRGRAVAFVVLAGSDPMTGRTRDDVLERVARRMP